MSPLEFAVQMAPLIGTDGVTTYASSLNGINLSAGDQAAIAIALTQALQEVFGLGPPAISEQLYGSVLLPPANVTFNATQFSTTISGFATWASWMEGCTVQGGDSEDNELISATQLLRPYMAGDGPVSATVYADAIRLPSWVKNTMDPVWTPRVPQLRAATSREEFRFYNSPYRGDTAHRHSTSRGAYYTDRNKTVGEPCVYFVEGRYDPTTGALPLFMRFNPMPGQAYPITFRVKRKPPVITAADLAGDTLVVAGTLTPDVAGTYPSVGIDAAGRKVYLRNSGSAVLIRSSSLQWGIAVPDGSGFWAGPTDPSPMGTYDAGFASTGTATVSAAGAAQIANIPTDWHESILLPFAKRWFIGHPAFQNPSAAAQIMAQYQVAKATLESFTPQISPAHGQYE